MQKASWTLQSDRWGTESGNLAIWPISLRRHRHMIVMLKGWPQALRMTVLYAKSDHVMDIAWSDFVTENEKNCISFLPNVRTSERFTTRCREADTQAYHVGCSFNTGVRCTTTMIIKYDRKTGVMWWHISDWRSEILNSARYHNVSQLLDCPSTSCITLQYPAAMLIQVFRYHYRCFWMLEMLTIRRQTDLQHKQCQNSVLKDRHNVRRQCAWIYSLLLPLWHSDSKFYHVSKVR